MTPGDLDGFVPWFFDEFLPPLIPWIVVIAIVVSIIVWVLTFWLGAKAVRRLRNWLRERRARKKIRRG